MMPVYEQLTTLVQQSNFSLITPEVVLILFILAAVLRLATSKTQEERKEIWVYALLGCLMCLVSLTMLWGSNYLTSPAFISVDVMGGLFTGDFLSLLFRTLMVVGTLLVLCFTRQYVEKNSEVPGEFYVILLSALLGGMMLCGAKDLIMIFVSLETLSISSYILVAYLRGHVLSAEAGLKYLLYGGMATAILLFGFSILYGVTGSTNLSEISQHLQLFSQLNPLVLALMTTMIVGGIAFKLTAAPFHMWAPDTYEGAPTPVVAFLSVVSKIAAFAFAIRIFTAVFQGLPHWASFLSVLAVTSMVVGNVVALAQTKMKRLLAYSTVAHVGYMLLGVLVLTPSSLSSVVYYLIAYLFMNLGAFAVVTQLEEQANITEISEYAGLIRKNPTFVFVLSFMFLSLAGIPITAGFFGKFFLFEALVAAGSQYLWLVIVALLTSTISLYYYLNVIRLMVIAEPSQAVETKLSDIKPSSQFSGAGLALSICTLATLLMGLFSEQLMVFSSYAVKGLTHQTASVQPKLSKVISLKAPASTAKSLPQAE